jgi:ubiquinone/menaquinone biosynthesis C-methylase UbiE
MISRSQKKELLDIATPPPEQLRAALLHLKKTNRIFLNDWLIARYVKQLITSEPSASVIDIGTGLADIPEYLTEKLNVKATGIDLNPTVTQLAQEYIGTNPKVRVETKPLEQFADNEFTVAVMSQMLHHLTPEEAVDIFQTALRKVTHGVIVSDLIRNHFSYYLTKWGIALTQPNRFNKTDGPLSVLRSYNDSEIQEIFRQAEITKYKIHNFIFRKIIVIYK